MIHKDTIEDKNIVLRPAEPGDAAVCHSIVTEGRLFQREQGFVQWEDGCPSPQTIISDIDAGRGMVLEIDGEAAGYMCLAFYEPAYEELNGKWNTEGGYGVIHRMAFAGGFRGKGLSEKAFALAGKICLEKDIHNLRIDTHEDNKRMQHVLTKNGFTYCGTVYYEDAGLRLAYDKKLD